MATVAEAERTGEMDENAAGAMAFEAINGCPSDPRLFEVIGQVLVAGMDSVAIQRGVAGKLRGERDILRGCVEELKKERDEVRSEYTVLASEYRLVRAKLIDALYGNTPREDASTFNLPGLVQQACEVIGRHKAELSVSDPSRVRELLTAALPCDCTGISTEAIAQRVLAKLRELQDRVAALEPAR